ncbi:MAG TPA: FecR domain-containing protein [Polyangiaceae bacterium]|jgi:hypothetical protein
MSDALKRMVREADRDWAVEAENIRWENVERRLFARIASEQRKGRSFELGAARSWAAAIAGLAAAGVAALAIVSTREGASFDPPASPPIDDTTTIARLDGPGPVLVNGHAVTPGTVLRADDVLEARGSQVVVSRPGKVTFLVERGSTVVVSRLRGSLVLGLQHGAVEAQVVPVASSEAMAVDVGTSRVAVHGTRFRVARTGERVVVDLNEGVVSVGPTPRVGSTLGGLVTAPAHADFAMGDPLGTLRVSHEPGDIRPPTPLDAATAPRAVPIAVSPAISATTARVDAGEVAAPALTTAQRTAEPHQASTASGWAGPSVADPNAQAGVATAVRACLAERLHTDSVTVVVSTTLYLQLHEDGSVGSARFDPPVAPDVNACAAESIYHARFTHGGAVSIPVSVKN